MAVASAGPYKSAPRSRQITTQFFYRPDALSAAQPTESKHCRLSEIQLLLYKRYKLE